MTIDLLSYETFSRVSQYDHRFIDKVHEEDLDRLRCTSELLQAIFQTYCISSRVARLLERQHMPGRVVQYDPITQKPIYHREKPAYPLRVLPPRSPSNANSFSNAHRVLVLGHLPFGTWY